MEENRALPGWALVLRGLLADIEEEQEEGAVKVRAND